MCHRLKKTSRAALIDMGASLSFHGGGKDRSAMPAICLQDLFTKFGTPFDHVHAFEIKPTKPADVFSKVPRERLSACHADQESHLNPLNLILDNFNEDDFVIVKLDIDAPSVELPLAHQLLENPKLHKLADHLSFEHHVKLGESMPAWGRAVEGMVQDSMELFVSLRKKGIPSHSWVQSASSW
jgi:hypothetical protein